MPLNNAIDNSAQQISLPVTSSNTTGIVSFGGFPILHAYDGAGTLTNVFLGKSAGNFTTITGTNNVGIGPSALNTLSTGTNNVAVGLSSMFRITTGSNNVVVGFNSFNAPAGSAASNQNVFIGSSTALSYTSAVSNTVGIGHQAFGQATSGDSNTGVGYQAFASLLTGTNNIGIGNTVGSAYTGAESSNILIGSAGVVGESNKVRIGANGAGAGQQNQCICAGVVYATGDDGIGLSGANGFTNAVNTTQSTGADTIKSTSAASNSNTGFIKFYVGTTAVFVPYWATP